MTGYDPLMPGRRAYVSPYRETAAARTRALILRHAAELFATRGYARVTVADIAAAAGVATKTVFASVGSKAEVLNQIVDKAVADSGYEHTVAEVLAARTAAEALRAVAHGTRLGNEGQSTALEAIRKALPVHDDGEALWQRATAAYRDALHTVAAHLQAIGGLPGAYTVDAAAGLLWLWFGPAGWHTLVTESGWTWDQAEDALHRTALAVFAHTRDAGYDSGIG
jgi:AcrR family transcriptional regulator